MGAAEEGCGTLPRTSVRACPQEDGWKEAWSRHLLSLHFLTNTVTDAVRHSNRLPTSRIPLSLTLVAVHTGLF